ncbi:glycosyltransferase family 39 protein [Maribacter confluentis]|uniref:Glycosyltransferase family 39 protein n=1 Tax=Maribacter confluentis TaxID=1656093 RepID=A0ABT8RLI0_9FLAO|nr:glycosyltransferase family 39 protein [Maribacter confluentis]MDO1511788.1 glycosyltransferase family 39 protein [Maribacter confluentis]
MVGKGDFGYKVALLAFISFLAITGITLLKSALELEDAEQAYYTQWLRLGYDDQPPLYTWVQYGINKIIGVHKIAFSLFRGILFALTLFVLYRFALVRLKHNTKAQLATLLLVLVPVCIDFMFRRLSHTSLLCIAIIGTYFCVHQLIKYRTYPYYVLLGLLVGVGILSKYNFVFFLITLLVVSIWDKKLFSAIWNIRVLISIIIALAIIYPHISWLLGFSGYQVFLSESIQEKVMGNTIKPTFSLLPVLTFLKGILALVYVMLIVLALGFFFKVLTFKKPVNSWFLKMAIVQFLVLLLFFVVFQTQKVETRWLLPLFIPFTILLMESIELKNGMKVVKIGYWLFYSVLFAQVVRTPLEQLLQIKSSVQYGFHPVAKMLEDKYPDDQWTLPNVTYAGNIRLLRPGRTIIAQDDYSYEDKHTGEPKLQVSFNKPANGQYVVMDSILDFGKEKQNIYFYSALGN